MDRPRILSKTFPPYVGVMQMEKEELKRIALRLYNQGVCNDNEIEYSPLLESANYKEIKKCIDYVHEIFRTGKRTFKDKYKIK